MNLMFQKHSFFLIIPEVIPENNMKEYVGVSV